MKSGSNQNNTGWELINRPKREEAGFYPDYSLFPGKNPSAPAMTPGNETASANEYYFRDHAEFIISEAEKRGLFVALLKTITATLAFILSSACAEAREIVIKPSAEGQMTSVIQQAVDRLASEGGGTVRLVAGTYASGTLELRNNVTLYLDRGALLKGSDKYSDYRFDAFIYGRELSNISIAGKGTIDGVDCYNPKGEEGFRGPHCIKLNSCRNISISGITIQNSANWAINCRYCSYGNVTNVTILGGHDGLHTRFCNNFKASGCDFRTGDDCFAGNDNRDFEISDCSINTSCNGFRMGCMNLKVKKCRFWGPGQYLHLSQNRHNMLSAFVHFSPKDEKPQLLSGNWIIEDITVENVDNFFIYNFRDGLWQTGQPFTNAEFKKIRAAGLLRSFYIQGDAANPPDLLIENSSFSRRIGPVKTPGSFEGATLADSLFFSAGTFGKIVLHRTQLSDREKELIAQFSEGKIVELDVLSLGSLSDTQAFSTTQAGEIILRKVSQNGYDITGRRIKGIRIAR